MLLRDVGLKVVKSWGLGLAARRLEFDGFDVKGGVEEAKVAVIESLCSHEVRYSGSGIARAASPKPLVASKHRPSRTFVGKNKCFVP